MFSAIIILLSAINVTFSYMLFIFTVTIPAMIGILNVFAFVYLLHKKSENNKNKIVMICLSLLAVANIVGAIVTLGVIGTFGELSLLCIANAAVIVWKLNNIFRSE
jgi:hypothetical protein